MITIYSLLFCFVFGFHYSGCAEDRRRLNKKNKIFAFILFCIRLSLSLQKRSGKLCITILNRQLTTRDMFGLGTQEILIIALIVLLLFGGKKIPELMKGLGKGVKSFKEGMNEVTDITKDERKEKKDE